MPEYPTGTVAFLFTDIEGSTKRWERNPEAMWQVVERHFSLLRDAIVAQNGVLFKTIGDAVQAAFPSAPAAVAAAVQAQSALREEDWGDLGPLRVRMAIHIGEATPRDGDYLAPSLNRLARLLSTGFGEQILLSEAARASVGSAFPPGCDVLDLGSHRLRDLLQPEHVYQLRGPGLVVDFPPLKSLDRHLHNLPSQPTALLGRETEVAAVRAFLEQEGARVVTLTGPGGTGKTRLGLQVGAELVEAFADGVWFVPLATITDPDLVIPAIAQPLGVREVAGEPLMTTLQDYLKSKHALLLLDNFEQVTAAASAVSALLSACPGIQVLVSSREPLRIAGEREFPVQPLPLPTERQARALPPATLLEYPAIRLFVECAQAVKPDFALTEASAPDVATICRRLDGLPLAIELAAARARVLAPAQLLARLDKRLKVLTGGNRDLPERQQTLRAAIEWSYDLLDPDEQTLFARLAVFSGGCTVEAAEAVCGAAGDLDLDVLDGLDSLTQKSLLRPEDGADGVPRFTMLQTIHEFAEEHLEELPEVDVVRKAHADAYLGIAEDCNWDDMSHQGAMLDRLEVDHANLRQAIGYYESQGESGIAQLVRLTSALAYFWWVRGHLSLGRHLIDHALEMAASVEPLQRAAALWGAALLAEAQWDLDRARRLHEEALVLRREAGDAAGIAGSLTGLGVIARQQGDLKSARALHQEALDAWRRVGDGPGTAGALLDLGVIRLFEGDYEGAAPVLLESLGFFQQLHDDSGEASVLQCLGFLAMSTGHLVEANDRFGESLRRWRALGNQQMIAMDLTNLGEALHLGGSLDEAELLLREAFSLFEALGDPAGTGSVLHQLGRLALDRGNGEEARTLLVESLRLRWPAGERGAAIDTLEALAEVTWHLGDLDFAAALLQAAIIARTETGFARQPVYEDRFRHVLDAVCDRAARIGPRDLEETVAKAMGQSALRASFTI